MQTLRAHTQRAAAGSRPGRVQRARLVVRAGGGFGKGGGAKGPKVDLSGGMAIRAKKEGKQKAAPPPPPGAAPAGAVSGSGWATVGRVDDLFTLEKPAKAVVLPSGVKLCVYKFGGKVFASALESTAYQFPLFDGKLSLEGGRVVVEVPLDGTQYDLATGQVLKWCPSEGNMLRGVLGALKSKQPAVPLQVYPTEVAADGTVSVKLV